MPGPPEPFEGLVSIAEFGDKLEAQIALNALVAEGFDATLTFDPALNTVATHFASDRTFELVVRAEDADAATAMLDDLKAGLPREFSDDYAVDYRRSPRRRRVKRVAMFLVFIMFGAPVLLVLLIQLITEL